MFRKLVLGFIAAASLTAAALAPTGASAGWKGHHHHHWGHHHGFGYGFGPMIVAGGGYADGCYVQRRVRTPYGLRWRTINVCY